MFYHAAGCTISEAAAGGDDRPSRERALRSLVLFFWSSLIEQGSSFVPN